MYDRSNVPASACEAADAEGHGLVDRDGNIYKALADAIPPEDRGRLDGYLTARAEADAEKHRRHAEEIKALVAEALSDGSERHG